jgi:hypothetical protein
MNIADHLREQAFPPFPQTPAGHAEITRISKPAVDVAEQRRLRLCSGGESGCGPIDHLDLDGRPQVLRQGIVERIAHAPGRRGDAGVEQPLSEPQ